jgi:hypothetical protein
MRTYLHIHFLPEMRTRRTGVKRVKMEGRWFEVVAHCILHSLRRERVHKNTRRSNIPCITRRIKVYTSSQNNKYYHVSTWIKGNYSSIGNRLSRCAAKVNEKLLLSHLNKYKHTSYGERIQFSVDYKQGGIPYHARTWWVVHTSYI